MGRQALMFLTIATVAASRADAQNTLDRRLSLEGRVVAMTPTFGIADQERVGAEVGAGWGVGLGYRLNTTLRLMADVDVGYHSSEIGDVNTYHYMAKLGFDVVKGGTVTVTLNAGAGVMAISPTGGESLSYFAINAGAKIGIKLGKAVELLISPQGDIAFADEDEVLTSKAWIWPLGLGLRVSF